MKAAKLPAPITVDKYPVTSEECHEEADAQLSRAMTCRMDTGKLYESPTYKRHIAAATRLYHDAARRAKPEQHLAVVTSGRKFKPLPHRLGAAGKARRKPTQWELKRLVETEREAYEQAMHVNVPPPPKPETSRDRLRAAVVKGEKKQREWVLVAIADVKDVLG